MQKILTRTPSQLYLGIAVLIFAASNSVTRKIVEIGQNHLIDGRNPISLCNVLFVGNLCALGLMTLIFHRDWKPRTLKALTRNHWISLSITGVLSGAIAPALIFTALEKTSVTNIVLIGRFEPIFTLLLSFLLLGSRFNHWTITGSIISLLGVAATAFLGSSEQTMMIPGVHLGVGDIYVAIAALIAAVSTIMGKLQLQAIPLGIIIIYRNITGTVIFFILANLLYGLHHFMDIFSPFLWQWMLIYAAIIVVAGQLFWLVGLRKSTSTEINFASLLNPILAIMMAYLILGEVPNSAQYVGGFLLLVGVILSFMGNLSQSKRMGDLSTASPIEKIDTPMGFRGI
ncbi:MAG: DMT family transporter [Snowella sp.]|nr:DMT family transporter [Snowella sp.]